MAESQAPVTRQTDMLNDLLIESMRCDVCNHYLTPPVLQCVSLHVVCGECAIADTCKKCDKEFVRIPMHKILESLSLLKFPCMYGDAECKYWGSWTELRAHEAECTSRVYTCPASKIAKCSWTGKAPVMKSHFKDHHRILNLVDNKHPFGTNLMARPNAVYLVAAHESTFILSISFVEEVLLVALNYLGAKSIASTFTYTIQISTIHSKLFLSQSSVATSYADPADDNNNTISLDINLLNSLSKTSPLIILELSIVSTETPAVFSIDALNKLKCPVCLEYMRSLINICEFGHSFCNNCRLLVNVCPICRGSIASARNYTLEELCQVITFPPS